MSRAQYKKLKENPKLEETRIHLNSPGGPIKCLGKCSAQIRSVKGVETKQTVYFIATGSENLLGRRAIQALDLVSVNEIGPLEVIKCTPVKILLQEESVPYNLSCPRRVPIPLHQKVQKELERMKELEVIEEVSDSTDWCSSIVLVLKKNGEERICTDFKNLKKYLKRDGTCSLQQKT
ncbi:Pol polyprotein [Plakobranchus ocellatus]|uniref:Pol polyprotein n=1 Tax=Plakobranchus ocellatus TaxID=259542 RepID=A0AAV4DV31_9GAST|nr:Pol polyprotein [Plakobranchus ocellatus]